jgi:hypothetical protein
VREVGVILPARGTSAAVAVTGPGLGGGAVRFAPEVVLSKEEVFGACQALADAGRLLVRSGGAAEADVLCALFTLLEDRLVAG